MRRGRLSNAPPPRYWVDYRIVLDNDLSKTMQFVYKVASDTIFFDSAAKRLPLQRSVLNWFIRNHKYAFDIIVFGQGTGCLDALLKEALKNSWVQNIYWSIDIKEVLSAIKEEVGVLGFLTADPQLLNLDDYIIKFTGPTMNLNSIEIEYQQI